MGAKPPMPYSELQGTGPDAVKSTDDGMSSLLHATHQIVTLRLFDLRIAYSSACHRAKNSTDGGLVAIFGCSNQGTTNATKCGAFRDMVSADLLCLRSALGLVSVETRARSAIQL